MSNGIVTSARIICDEVEVADNLKALQHIMFHGVRTGCFEQAYEYIKGYIEWN